MGEDPPVGQRNPIDSFALGGVVRIADKLTKEA